MSGDFQKEKGTSFGDWLHQQISDVAYFEQEASAIDRVRRVGAGPGDSERLLVEIPWLDVFTAFTTPGPVYLLLASALRPLRQPDMPRPAASCSG